MSVHPWCLDCGVLESEHDPGECTFVLADDQHLNPECREGKHLNCHEDAWCVYDDCPVDCACRCHEEERVDSGSGS